MANITTEDERGEWDSNPWAILGESKIHYPQIISFEVPKTLKVHFYIFLGTPS